MYLARRIISREKQYHIFISPFSYYKLFFVRLIFGHFSKAIPCIIIEVSILWTKFHNYFQPLAYLTGKASAPCQSFSDLSPNAKVRNGKMWRSRWYYARSYGSAVRCCSIHAHLKRSIPNNNGLTGRFIAQDSFFRNHIRQNKSIIILPSHIYQTFPQI